MDYELAIVGAGPAGYSAAIYAVRAGVKPLLFDKGFGGGLAAISPKIENYPGFESISGMELVEKMKQHASKYTEINLGEEVKDIEKTKDGFTVVTDKKKYNLRKNDIISLPENMSEMLIKRGAGKEVKP